MCIGWMLGWEDVTYLKLTLYLVGCMPLPAMAGIIVLIIQYQVEIHKSQPSLVEHTFEFMDCIYMAPTEGAEIEVTNHKD